MDKMTESYAKPEAVAFSWLLVWPWWEWVPLQTPPKVEVLVVDCDDCPYLLLHTLLLHMAISHTCCFEKEMDEHDSVTSALICSVLLMLTSRLSCLPYAKWENWSRKDADRSLAFAGSLGYLLTKGCWELRDKGMCSQHWRHLAWTSPEELGVFWRMLPRQQGSLTEEFWAPGNLGGFHLKIILEHRFQMENNFPGCNNALCSVYVTSAVKQEDEWNYRSVIKSQLVVSDNAEHAWDTEHHSKLRSNDLYRPFSAILILKSERDLCSYLNLSWPEHLFGLHFHLYCIFVIGWTANI